MVMAVFQKSVHFLHHQIYHKSVLVKSLFLYNCVMNECDRDLITYTTHFVEFPAVAILILLVKSK